jgi:hypothetical protein
MYKNILEVKQRNKANGFWWFSPNNIRFFKSRFGDNVYGGKYFVSSAKMDWDAPRLYTVHEALENGDVVNVSELGEYATWQGAYERIQAILKQEGGENNGGSV